VPKRIAVPQTEDDFADLIMEYDSRPPEQAAAALESLVERLPAASEVTRAEVLAAAAAYRGGGGDYQAALALLERARADGSASRVSLHAMIASVLLAADRRDEAREQLAEIPLAATRNVRTLGLVAQIYADLDDLPSAHKWLTKAASIAERNESSLSYVPLILRRRSIREELGYPADDFDEVALDYQRELLTSIGFTQLDL
jgi:hypothetical protein